MIWYALHMFLVGFGRFTHQGLQGGFLNHFDNLNMKIIFNGKIFTSHTNVNTFHNAFSHSQHLQEKNNRKWIKLTTNGIWCGTVLLAFKVNHIKHAVSYLIFRFPLNYQRPNLSLKGSYDTFLKTSIIIFKYCIILGPLSNPVFYKVPPSKKHSLLRLANWPRALWLAEKYKHESEKCKRPFL